MSGIIDCIRALKLKDILMGVPKPDDNHSKVVVTEGVSGTWFYHLGMSEDITHSLCGEQVMPTSLPINSWGVVTHLRERYCDKCFKMYVSKYGK